MTENRNEIKGWAAVVIGFIVCPCHLPITLPIALSLTAGTAIGAWLTNNTALIWVLFTLLFLGGLAIGFHWLTREEDDAQNLGRGPKTVLVLTSQTCSSCEETASLWRALQPKYKFRLQVLDINTRQGRRLAGEKNILSTPATLINGKVKFRGLPSADRAEAAVR